MDELFDNTLMSFQTWDKIGTCSLLSFRRNHVTISGWSLTPFPSNHRIQYKIVFIDSHTENSKTIIRQIFPPHLFRTGNSNFLVHPVQSTWSTRHFFLNVALIQTMSATSVASLFSSSVLLYINGALRCRHAICFKCKTWNILKFA